MKKIILTSAAVLLGSSMGVSAHQLSSPYTHNGAWDWNQSNHTHANKPVKSSLEVIKGMKGLEGLAKAGECYISAYVEGSCSNQMVKVMVSPAYDETEVVAAVTKEVEERVMISPAKLVEEYVPALYETKVKKVMVAPARTEWKKGNFTATTKLIDNQTYCLVEVPAEYKDVSEKILQVPAATKTREVPAVYKTYKKTVIVTPATTRIIKSHPAVYSEVEECVAETAGRYEWRSVLCQQNATNDVLVNIEKALSDKGFNVTTDGVIDDNTTNALKKYQRKNGLKVDGLVNIETVKSLGVSYK